MNIIIIGDKPQKNMKSKGCVGLIKYNKINMVIENQYSVLRSLFPRSKIIYVYGFDNKRFKQYLDGTNKKVKCVLNSNYEKSNAGLSLGLAKDFLNDNCLVVNGNAILNKKIFESFKVNNQSQVFVSQNKKISEIGCIINNSKVENFSLDLINCIYPIYYISKKDSQILKNIVSIDKHNNYFVFEILNKMIDVGVCFTPTYIKSIPNQLSSLDKTLVKK
jgi:CTP:phosphocholine cytidylyltransferase-like protein